MYSEPRSHASISCIKAFFLLFVFSEWFVSCHVFTDCLDWAVYCLAGETYRRSAVLLYASSYVTWTFQTHTFSNSIEAVLVSCSLVAVIIFKHSRVSSHVKLFPNRLGSYLVVSILLRDIMFSWCFFSHYFPGVLIPCDGILHSRPP
jgi:hypothetical protein